MDCSFLKSLQSCEDLGLIMIKVEESERYNWLKFFSEIHYLHSHFLLFLKFDVCHRLIDILSIGDGLSLLFFYALLIRNNVPRNLNPPLRKSLFVHLALLLFSLLLLLLFPLAGFHLFDDPTLELQGLASYLVLLRVSP